MPEQSMPRPAGRSGLVILAAAAAWVLVYFGCRFILDAYQLSTAPRIAVALAPMIPFLAFLLLWIANMRSLDELNRRVQLEALAFAFPATLVVLMILGLLQLAITLPPNRFAFRDVWPIMPMLYFTGLAWSWRRYS